MSDPAPIQVKNPNQYNPGIARINPAMLAPLYPKGALIYAANGTQYLVPISPTSDVNRVTMPYPISITHTKVQGDNPFPPL